MQREEERWLTGDELVITAKTSGGLGVDGVRDSGDCGLVSDNRRVPREGNCVNSPSQIIQR